MFVILMPILYALFLFCFTAALEETSQDGVQFFNASEPERGYTCSQSESIAYVPNTTDARNVMISALSYSNTSCTLTAYDSYSELRSSLLANNQARTRLSHLRTHHGA